ncbi:hypothetical protein L249_1943, partial [Ophiocordyceps polyrhachis-furcata BCC 54312]
IRTFSRKKGEFSAFLTNLKDKIRTNKATFRDKENRIGFLFRSLNSKARKTLETYNPNKFAKAAKRLYCLNFSISNLISAPRYPYS